MLTVRSLPYRGLCLGGICPWGSLSRDSLSGDLCQGDPPPPQGTLDQGQTPPLPPKEHGTKITRQEVTSYRDPQSPPPPVNRMTRVSKNITLPQTLFAGGKY